MNDEPDKDDAEWLRSVIDQNADALVRYATSILRDGDGARDVVQETFVRLWREPRQTVDDHVIPWLFRVCRNRALDKRRKEGRMTSLDQSAFAGTHADSRPHPDALAESRDSHSRVLEMLDGLPDNQREVVRLKFQNDLSYKEIAEITEVSVSNVGFLLHTALKTLRTRMAASGE